MLIEPLLPVAATGPLPRRVRDQFNGVIWRFRTGSGWRDVPERYGPWSTVYSRFNNWARAGVFQGLMEALIAEAAGRGLVGLELVSVDSTVVRAHQDSAGLAVAGETLDALEQALTEEKVPLWFSSSRRSSRCLVEGAVAEHGEEYVDPASGKGNEGCDVVFPLAALLVVVGA
jgi:transposase